jgi:hypothetical protein
MDFARAQQDVLSWLTDFVEQPNSQLNGWPPCPYARKARLAGEFDIRPGTVDPYTDLRACEITPFAVVAYVYDPDQYSAEEFDQQIQAVNQGFLIPRALIALADHPGSLETVKGVVMNQGRWAIAFVQPLKELNHFARALAGKGYYDGWPEDYLRDLFVGREDPRS